MISTYLPREKLAVSLSCYAQVKLRFQIIHGDEWDKERNGDLKLMGKTSLTLIQILL